MEHEHGIRETNVRLASGVRARARGGAWAAMVALALVACAADAPPSPPLAPDAQPACAVGLTQCEQGCVLLASDPANCGACGRTCAGAEVCADSRCEPVCPVDRVACAGACVDPARDDDHCGARADCTGVNAGATCGEGLSCIEGACAIALSGSGGGRWGYRRVVPIAGSIGGDQSGYAVPVTVDTAALVNAGTLQASGADLRFATPDGTELPWWSEAAVVGHQARLWVRVPSIRSAGTHVYLYYGNPAAVVVATYHDSGVHTFDLFDDFDGLALDVERWHAGQFYGLPTQVDGRLHLYSSCPNNGCIDADEIRTVATFAGSTVAEFVMTMNTAPQPSWRSQEAIVRIGAPDTVSNQPLAQVITGWWSNGVRDCPATNGAYLGRAEVDGAGGTYRLRLGAAVCGEKPMPASSQPYVFAVALEGGWGTTALDLDDFRVRRFVDPEPIAGPPGAEQAL